MQAIKNMQMQTPIPFLYFSGIPVVCAKCGSQVQKISYGKGKNGEYLCHKCKTNS